MANDVIVGAPLLATGGVQAADPETATLPTDAVTALTGYTALGLIGEDGVSETADRSTEQIRAWGGSLARVVQTEFGLSYTFQFLETNRAVMEEIHGVDNVTFTAGDGTTTEDSLAIQVNKNELPRRVYVFEIKDGDNRVRIVCPNAQITAVGDVTYSHNDAVRYEVTVSCYPDDSGNEAYKYVSGPIAAAAA